MKIYKDNVDDGIIDAIVRKVKAKKELANLDETICKEKLKELLTKDKKLREKLATVDSYEKVEKSKEIKLLVKECRKQVRHIYGAFVKKDIAEAEELLLQLMQRIHCRRIHKKLLSLHTSSRERLSFYEEFYKKIFAITGKPNSILDLASGFNPMSLPYSGIKEVDYTAVELNKDDVKLLNDYFKIVEVKGKALCLDLEKEDIKFKADVCFAFKLFDLLKTKTVERLIKQIDCKWFVVSFSTKTLSFTPMRVKRRGWFQKMLRRLGLKYETLTFENELVYIIKKN